MLRRLCMILSVLATAASALEYRSTLEPVILYDAPSLKGHKQWMLGRDVPVEVIVQIEGWVKVRDAGGTIAWAERKALGERKHVQVKTTSADILSAPDPSAQVVFRAEQGVLLAWLESGNNGWVRVRHAGGQSGFVRIEALFGV